MDKDLLVIGGGINGLGIAADAAGRGLSVVLCETGDLASATSSASSKLIHGGLRYLENAEFGLVRESLRERRILLHLAPHLIKPQAFVMPHSPNLRPYWLIRLGLYLYDFLSMDSKIPRSRSLSKDEVASLELKTNYKKALEYFDCTEDDSRLALHVAMLARQHGAEILPRTKLVKAIRKDDSWLVTLVHDQDMKVYNVKAIINTAGPWVQQIAQEILHIEPKFKLTLVKGSHIVVPRLFKHDRAFILQNADQRVVFVIPYLKDFTLIGTTDVELNNIEYPTKISVTEIEYLCNSVNQYLQQQITATDVVWDYSGIRSLHESTQTKASKLSRDYVIDINTDTAAPVISICGGKITTYRSLAEHVVNLLGKFFPRMGKPWTKQAYLPGGYFPNDNVLAFTKHCFSTYPHLPRPLIQHYVDTYGTRCVELLMHTHNVAHLGQHFGGLLYQREVDYLVRNEWALHAEDILWRRGKQGMWLNTAQAEKLEKYLQQRVGSIKLLSS